MSFVPVLVTSNFDDDSIKNERAIMGTPFSHYKSWEIFRRSRADNSAVSCPIWPKFDATEKRWKHHFTHYKSMGAFCCHGHQNFNPNCLQTLCSLSPPPLMLYIKFDQVLPTGLRDIQVRKCRIFVIQGQITPK